MASTPEQQAQTMIDNLPAKTGKSLDQWMGVCGKTGLVKHGEIVKHLKTDHGVTHGFANLIALQAAQRLGPGLIQGSADPPTQTTLDLRLVEWGDVTFLIAATPDH